MNVWFKFILFCFSSAILQAQNQLPDWGLAFLQNEVASIKISIDPDSLDAAYSTENWNIDREFPATFRYESTQLTQTVNNIGFRLRGNTSLYAQKKSFKVSFNTYTQGNKWQELEKLNLISNQNDPSMIRAKLCWDAMRDAGLPGARVSFVKVYVNEEYKGLYSNVEHIDENFTKQYFDNNGGGNLYKCLFPATLEYLGSNSNLYKLESGGRRTYELTTNDWIDDYSDFAKMVTVLNQTNNNDLICALSKQLNIENYIKYAALDVISGNWDGYIYNKNNFYLYKNKLSNQFEYIPYDLDNTLGIDWVNQNWTTRNIYNWAPSSEDRPLFKRLMENPEFKNKFSFYINHYLETVYNPTTIAAKAQQFTQLIAEAAQADVYRTYDYNFSYNDFLNAFTQTFGGHVEHGIQQYLNLRKQTALNQLNNISEFSAIKSGWIVSDEPHTTGATFYAWVDTLNLQSVSVEWGNALNNLNQTVVLSNSASDIFSGFVNQFPPENLIFYQFKLVSVSNGITYWPCNPAIYYNSAYASALVINEIMSRNTNTIADENGEFDDWIELWNGGTTAINLQGKYLTDKANNKLMWPMPSVTLQAGEFKLFWADSDEQFNRNHTSFSLSANGEDLRLYQSYEGVPQIIDRVVFPALSQNVSWGRTTDGNLPFIIFNTSTPQASNNSLGIEKLSSNKVLYPNPSNGLIHLMAEQTHVEVYNATGSLVFQTENSQTINLTHLANGLYWLKTPKFSSSFIIAR